MTAAEMIAGLFNRRFDEIQKELPFDPEWSNGTGYFDGAVDLKLAPGEEAKSISPMPNNRKMIFIGTQLGTIVLFERYTDGANGVITRNLPRDLERLSIIPHGQLGYDALNNILGYSEKDNIGARLAWMFNVKPGKAE